MSATWSLGIGWLIAVITFIVILVMFSREDKKSSMLFTVSGAVYLWGIFYTWDVLNFNQEAVLSLLVVSTLLAAFLGHYTGKEKKIKKDQQSKHRKIYIGVIGVLVVLSTWQIVIDHDHSKVFIETNVLEADFFDWTTEVMEVVMTNNHSRSKFVPLVDYMLCVGEKQYALHDSHSQSLDYYKFDEDQGIELRPKQKYAYEVILSRSLQRDFVNEFSSEKLPSDIFSKAKLNGSEVRLLEKAFENMNQEPIYIVEENRLGCRGQKDYAVAQFKFKPYRASTAYLKAEGSDTNLITII